MTQTHPCIEAENYFKAVKAQKRECPRGGFEMRLAAGGELYFPNIHNVPEKAVVSFSAANGNRAGCVIEIREGNPGGALLGACRVRPTGGWNQYHDFSAPLTACCKLSIPHYFNRLLSNKAGVKSLCFVAKSGADEGEAVRVDRFSFAAASGSGASLKINH